MTISDLNQEIRDLCDADSSSLTDATLLRRVNNALETLVAKLINADGTWQFDDTNYTDLPVGKGDLTSGSISYTFNSEFLDLEGIDILTLDGIYKRIDPFDAVEMGVSFEEYFNISFNGSAYVAPVGFPLYYDKQGDTIRLSAGPTADNTTLTKGIRLRFKRTASLFTSAEVTTGTKEPGIVSPFHQLIAYMAALPYCMSYKKDRVALFEREAEKMTKDMIKFYASREKDKRHIMTPKKILYI